MKHLLSRYVPLLLRIAIGFFVLWTLGALVLFWRSGDDETKEAFLKGRRFIIHVEDDRVDGARLLVEAPKEQVAIDIVSEEPEAGTTVVPKVRTSSNPIAEVSSELLEKVAGVNLPKIGESGVKPLQRYAQSFRRLNEYPLVAIVVTGLGHSKAEMELAAALDDRIGLSFSPYASFISSWAAASRLSGHEMYVELPVQTASYPNDDPGPYSILLSHTNDENVKNLYWAMSRFQGYIGVVMPPREVITNSPDILAPLRNEIAARGLMFLTMRDSDLQDKPAKDQAALVAMNADVWIDEELTEMSIQARLATLEQVAQRNGVAIGMVRSYPLSLKQVQHWTERLGPNNLVLAPASFITKLKYP